MSTRLIAARFTFVFFDISLKLCAVFMTEYEESNVIRMSCAA